MQRPLNSLEQGDRIEVTLNDGSEIVGLLQNAPDTGPPTTPDGEAAGWTEKTHVSGVHVEENNGTATTYESLLLTQERHGDEWGAIQVVGYRYYTTDYTSHELTEDVAEVTVRA
jgi:hypothetical protein